MHILDWLYEAYLDWRFFGRKPWERRMSYEELVAQLGRWAASVKPEDLQE